MYINYAPNFKLRKEIAFEGSQYLRSRPSMLGPLQAPDNIQQLLRGLGPP